MAFSLGFEDLKPYKSYIILDFKEGTHDLDQLNSGLIKEIERFITVKLPPGASIVDMSTKGLEKGDKDLWTGFIHYVEEISPVWSLAEDLRDTLQHIVVVARKENFIAIYFSEKGLGNKFRQKELRPKELFVLESGHRDSLRPGPVNHVLISVFKAKRHPLTTSDPLIYEIDRSHWDIIDGLRRYRVRDTDGGLVVSRMDFPLLAQMCYIPPSRLNAAFVKGRAVSLWLSGNHRRVAVKADNKILSGMDLEYALDPIGDQSYHFTSARCAPKESIGDIVRVGVTPRRSRAWVGPSGDWKEFAKCTETLLSYLLGVTDLTNEPLPFLSVPVENGVVPSGAFDIALTSPDILPEAEALDEDKKQEMELWSDGALYEIKETNGPDFLVKVTLNKRRGKSVGAFNFVMDQNALPDVDYKVTPASPSTPFKSVEKRRQRALKYLRNQKLVSVWYESGHTVKEGSIYEMRHRDVPFDNVQWEKLAGIDVSREKPDKFNDRVKAISADPARLNDFCMDEGEKRSLFCWVIENWWKQGCDCWLACDDGAMEIADFISLELSDPPVLSLIHVKGAHIDERRSTDPNRGISVADYEVVTGQAVKNLRYLESIILKRGLEAGLKSKVSSLVWHNGVGSNRTAMIDAIHGSTANIQKKIVVLQPRVTHTRHKYARATPDSGDASRLRQLDSLLLGAKANIQSVGAEFKVIMHDI